MNELIGLDFETYGAVDLSKHGLMRYVDDPSFKVLIASVAKRTPTGQYSAATFDFVNDPSAKGTLKTELQGKTVVAHNAIFEKMVLAQLGIHIASDRFIDSAMVARAAGAGGSLSAAAPQLLNTDKLDEGKNLVRLFCMPTKMQTETGDLGFHPTRVTDNQVEWKQFIEYCELDAVLSLRLYDEWSHVLTADELRYSQLTLNMNQTGWPVDVELVKEMQRRYEVNQERALADFQQLHSAEDLNLNSYKQVKEWCADRGIKANSFDEKHVAKLLKRIEDKLTSGVALPILTVQNYSAVIDLLETKQILGGSSLKKLQVILDTQLDGRLYDQYIHCGAGQTLRTTGRSVQMQNLKRLTTIEDTDELDDPSNHWDNEKLAENLRQVFTASHPQGSLIVGDFKSVESRGLAWLADEQWKLAAYQRGDDLYKVLATKIYGAQYSSITKEQRMTGKVGELSCGYGAGPDAVVSFAAGMGVELEQAEAAKLVWDWRDANPNIVEFWDRLNDSLQSAMRGVAFRTPLNDQHMLMFDSHRPPVSLKKLIPHGNSVQMRVEDSSGAVLLRRFFHGCHQRGRNISYFKPSARKTGDLWSNTFIDPKTKQRRYNELYGGKLAGILTQSLCREIFFRSLTQVQLWVERTAEVSVVGQFHDEIVADWRPGGLTLAAHMVEMENWMTADGRLPSFPLAADIKQGYRYIK